MANKVSAENGKKKQTLLIVESPSKAVTIKGYLGSNYRVLASVGHIRDLPKSTLGIDLENGFIPHYINIRGKGDVIKSLKKEAKNASCVLLATDPDREGEAISWHIADVLNLDPQSLCRVTFNEITKGAIKSAIKNPRPIDENLVDAQQARRLLDRIVGYQISPLLWKKVKSGLSAGRVQSVATRIITEREEEVSAFVPKEYWTVTAELENRDKDVLEARFYGDKNGKISIDSEKQALSVKEAVEKGTFKVQDIKRTQKQKQPAPPFTTSTLQQEAYHKLNFRSQRIMKVAQELYEGINVGADNGGVQGLITYMRTDSLRVSSVAADAAKTFIQSAYGDEYVPEAPRVYKAKAGAQDAHEAIRPSDVRLLPSAVKRYLNPDQYKLYKLIWERFIASQMASAVYDVISCDLENSGYLFKTGGYRIKFKGYTAVYESTEENPVEEKNYSKLPAFSTDEILSTKAVTADKHYTEPPARYTEASLIKFLEENGIGRPSTYTTIITTILTRGYVKREGKTLLPTPLGIVTTKLMKEHFKNIVDYEFTAKMETDLDRIESGDLPLSEVLTGFYGNFSQDLNKAKEEISKEEIEVPKEVSPYTCELCGSQMIYKNGRFGRFLACANYPECKNTKTIDSEGKPLENTVKEYPLADFKCELCGGDVVLRPGKYGQFYACKNYPACRFTRQKVQTMDVCCPECGGKMVVKRGRGKVQFYSCEKYPECTFSTWDLPTSETCPDCGKMLLYRKSKKKLYCVNKDCGFSKNATDGKEERE
ncbi:MAG: type I DNA topoisomerase [Clostridia bacterium]|nr:type I DNA topoisomerase [Clostridia bacterium]